MVLRLAGKTIVPVKLEQPEKAFQPILVRLVQADRSILVKSVQPEKADSPIQVMTSSPILAGITKALGRSSLSQV